MKTNLYVFSGTGNSLAAADKIAEVLGEDTNVLLIPSVLRNAVHQEIENDAEAVGFIFPNYFGGIPQSVFSFLGRVNLDYSTYLFSVITAASGQGYGLKLLEKELYRKGKRLSYGKYASSGKTNYIIGWYYNLINRRINEGSFQKMDERLLKIAQDIDKRAIEIQNSSYIGYKRSHLISQKEIRENTYPWDKEFSISDDCVGCGICQRVCQAKNITMVGNKPDFQHNCFRCMACFQYCPKSAVGYKGKRLMKEKYYHPEYPAEALIRRIHAD